MKICVPTTGNKGLGEEVSGHFGSAPYFTLVDTESGRVEVIENQSQDHSDGSCHPMVSLIGKRIKAVAAGGMGQRAIEMLNTEKIKVYKANGETVAKIVAAYKDGKLRELSPETACPGHGD